MFFVALSGCGIEEQVNKAATRCEDKISKILESVENGCLTKEEVLELLRAYEAPTDVDSCDGTVRSRE
jgi:hypothetical protein